jgi:hypothetical protein
MKSKKIRRHSGWKTPGLECVSIKYSELKDNALEPRLEYDDWVDYRDGLRDRAGLEKKKREIQKDLKKRKIQIKRWKKKIKDEQGAKFGQEFVDTFREHPNSTKEKPKK